MALVSLTHKVSRISKLDEININKVFDGLPIDVIKDLIKKRPPKASKVRKFVKHIRPPPLIPSNIKSAILTLRLLDEPSFNKRVELFVGYCLMKDYTYNSTLKHYNTLKKNGVFGYDYDSLLRPDEIAFVDRGRPHMRIVSMDDFKIFCRFIYNTISEYSAPILVAITTILRTGELLQFSTYTLFQLSNLHQVVAIKLKQTSVVNARSPILWRPVYNTHLNMLTDTLLVLFAKKYKVFLESDHKININLFDNITPKTVSNRIKSLFYQAVGHLPPRGFGAHSCRNMVAMLMSQNTDNIVAIQQMLQHRNVETTRKYIKADYTFTKDKFNKITEDEFKIASQNLQIEE